MSLKTLASKWWETGRPFAVGGTSQKLQSGASSRLVNERPKTSRSRQRSRIRSSSAGKDCFGSTGRNPATVTGFSQSVGGQRHRAVLGHRPTAVVRDLPWMAIGVDEDPGVAAPECLGRLAADRGARRASLLDHLIDLLLRARAVGGGHPSPPTLVGDHAVLGELLPVPQADDHATRLEENDIVIRGGSGLPAERLIEAAGAVQIRDSECDQAETLFHAGSFPS